MFRIRLSASARPPGIAADSCRRARPVGHLHSPCERKRRDEGGEAAKAGEGGHGSLTHGVMPVSSKIQACGLNEEILMGEGERESLAWSSSRHLRQAFHHPFFVCVSTVSCLALMAERGAENRLIIACTDPQIQEHGLCIRPFRVHNERVKNRRARPLLHSTPCLSLSLFPA